MRTAFTSAGLMSSGLSRNGSVGVRRVRVMGRGFIRCVMRRQCSLANSSRRHLTRCCVTDSLRNRPRRNIQDGGIPNDFSSWTVFGSFGIGSKDYYRAKLDPESKLDEAQICREMNDEEWDYVIANAGSICCKIGLHKRRERMQGQKAGSWSKAICEATKARLEARWQKKLAAKN